MATIPAPVLRHVRKTIAFDGSANNGNLGDAVPVFTRTGRVRVTDMTLFVSESLVCAAPTLTRLKLGLTGFGDIWATALVDDGGDGAVAGMFWSAIDGAWQLGGAPDAAVGALPWAIAANVEVVVGDDGGGADVTDGTIVIDAWYYQITDDGELTGDDASEAYLPADVQRWLGTTAQGASGRPQVDVELIEGADPSDTIRDAVVDDATRIDASQLNTHTAITAAGIADAVWDEAAAGHTDAGKAGEQLWTDVDAILVDTSTTLQGELDGIQADTEDIQSRLPAALVSGRIDATVDATGMESGAIDAILTRAMTESYNADGAAPTLAQALFAILQRLTEFSISGTTITVKKLDGSTSAFTLTLDSAGSPTSSTRAT